MKKKQEIQFFDFVIINSRLVLKTFNKDNGLSDLRSVDLDLFRIRIFLLNDNAEDCFLTYFHVKKMSPTKIFM